MYLLDTWILSEARRKLPGPIADAPIAATASVDGKQLVTRNVAHFLTPAS